MILEGEGVYSGDEDAGVDAAAAEEAGVAVVKRLVSIFCCAACCFFPLCLLVVYCGVVGSYVPRTAEKG